MPRIKGSTLRDLLHAAHERGLYAAIVAGLPAEHQRTLARPIVGAQWYPYSLFTSVMEAIERAGDDTGDGCGLLRSFARDAGRRALGMPFKALASMMRLGALIERAEGAWTSHCDRGQCVVVHHSATGYEGEVRGFPDIHRLHCVWLEGWLEGIMEAFGAANVDTTQTRCVHRGDSVCGYTTTWDVRRRLFG